MQDKWPNNACRQLIQKGWYARMRQQLRMQGRMEVGAVEHALKIGRKDRYHQP